MPTYGPSTNCGHKIKSKINAFKALISRIQF